LSTQRRRRGLRLRGALAILIALLIVTYTVGILSGGISAKNRIDVVHLALIALGFIGITLLVRPDVLDRVRLFEMSGLRLEMLERVQEAQVKQEGRLEDIALILPLLLPETERRHLLNLGAKRTAGYRSNSALRSELRRLRSIGLIRMRPDRHVGQIAGGIVFDLSDFLELTELGDRWVRRIGDIERAEEEVQASKHGEGTE
jgi:hypothetical protein